MSLGQIAGLEVLVPPGSKKSLTCAVEHPAWEWGPFGRPDMRFGFSTHSATLTFRDARKMRALVESPQYQELWPLEFKKDNNRLDEYSNVRQGIRISSSTGGSPSGHRVHRWVYDDLISVNDAYSAAAMAEAKAHLGATSSRAIEPAGFQRLLIMQRVAKGDPADMLAEMLGDQCYRYSIPAEFDRQRRCSILMPSGKVLEDPRTEQGELFFPARFPASYLAQQRKDLGSYDYNAQYQQDPVTIEGGVLKPSWARMASRRNMPGFFGYLASWDTAYTENIKNDQSAGLLFGLCNEPGRSGIYRLSQQAVHQELPELKVTIAAMAKSRLGTRTWVEAKASGLSVIQEIQRGNRGLLIEPFKPIGSEEVRAHAAAPFMEQGLVWLFEEDVEWNKALFEQLKNFPSSRRNDIAAAFVQAILIAGATYTFETPTAPVFSAITAKEHWDASDEADEFGTNPILWR
jgi:predicted phage terminase large subunit-like protein